MNLKLIVDIANVFVGIGVLFAITQININRKALHFNTIQRCIDAFRKLEDKGEYKEKDVVRYIDLVNEELFYFQHRYLPKAIAYEWLDGMLDYMPVTDNENNILNGGHCLSLLESNRDEYLQNYPRLKETFILRQSFDIEIVYNKEPSKQTLRTMTRKGIVEELYNNIMAFSF